MDCRRNFATRCCNRPGLYEAPRAPPRLPRPHPCRRHPCPLTRFISNISNSLQRENYLLDTLLIILCACVGLHYLEIKSTATVLRSRGNEADFKSEALDLE